MIDLRPLFFGLAGAARLIRLDISGAKLMVGGAYGFWHSLFWSAGLVLPLYTLLMLLRFNPEKYDGWRYLFVHGETYIIAWLIFPIVMERISYFINRRQYYLEFIIAYNWLNCLYNTMYLLISLAHASGLIDINAATAGSIGLMLIGLFWIGHLAKKTLQIPISASVGVVVLDLFIGVMVSMVSAALLAR